MPNYRRAHQPGGTFFFTVVTAGRQPLFASQENRTLLHDAIAESGPLRPVEWLAVVLLPDHLHAIWELPVGDSDFSTRWASIKAGFTRRYLASGGAEAAGVATRKGSHAVWQERFWEHTIRDQEDLNNHLDYIHYNPVKHGLAACPHACEHSSFQRWVAKGGYAPDWLCICRRQHATIPDFSHLAAAEMDS